MTDVELVVQIADDPVPPGGTGVAAKLIPMLGMVLVLRKLGLPFTTQLATLGLNLTAILYPRGKPAQDIRYEMVRRAISVPLEESRGNLIVCLPKSSVPVRAREQLCACAEVVRPRAVTNKKRVKRFRTLHSGMN
ncbi:hypothetical protein [Herbaspirillum sp. YR522]|uniref:hypothetical protein n=1 Tax=Herbaspirillum sp. YR522 TaxID=1144342 RepID=UPI0012F78B3C|nr:hypothetical protein [Herbaspirillum sp. YR522]